jgi:hypothetical protein
MQRLDDQLMIRPGVWLVTERAVALIRDEAERGYVRQIRRVE